MPAPNKNTTALLVFLLTISFYVFTLSPSLAWGDGVKLQSEVISGESFLFSEMSGDEFSPDPFPFSKVGVSAWDHPLYIVLGHLLVHALPAVDSLWLVNLISAFFGAASIVLVFRLCLQYTDSVTGSLYAALSLAVSHTFWWHASTPEVYTFYVFLLLLSVSCFDQFERTGRSSLLALSAFTFGLSAASHILAFLAIPALAMYFFLTGRYRQFRREDFKALISPFIAFLAGFSLYLIQLLRMTRNFSFSEIMGPVVGRTFLENLSGVSPALLGASLLTYVLFLVIQFGPQGILFGVIGLRGLRRNTDAAVWKPLAFFIVYTGFGILYRVTDQFAFFMTSHVFFAILMAIGSSRVLTTMGSKHRFALTMLLVASILLTPFIYRSIPRLAESFDIGDDIIGIPQVGTGVRNGLAYYLDPNKRGDTRAYEFGREAITNLPPDSVVIAEWYADTDEYFILRYFKEIEGLRGDVTILGFPTIDPFSFDSQLVVGVITEALPTRPVYLSSLSEKFYDATNLLARYCIVPENKLFRIYPADGQPRPCLDVNSVTD